jgi:hypothetical protein
VRDRGDGGRVLVAATAGAQLAPGTILNADTWQQADGKLPPEFLDRYKNGQWQHEYVEAPAGTHFGDDDFLAAGAKNAGQYALGPDGGVVESGSGKQPPFIYGPPFPVIDKNDPQAGAKIVWNFFYQSYLLGNSHNQVSLEWVGNAGMQRSIATDVYQHFFDGQPEKYRPPSNDQNFLFQQISAVTAPADLQGTVALTHRFRDPSRAIRRGPSCRRCGACARCRRPIAPTAFSAPTCRRTTARTSMASRRTSIGSSSARARCCSSWIAPR